MEKQCLKCGYERSEKDTAPEVECPKCGIIYAKILARQPQERAEDFDRIRNSTKQNLTVSESNTGKYLLGALLLGGLAIVLFFVFQRSGKDSVVAYDDDYVAVAQISNGERVNLKEHLIPGRYTIFFFYADW